MVVKTKKATPHPLKNKVRQIQKASVSYPECHWFKSNLSHTAKPHAAKAWGLFSFPGWKSKSDIFIRFRTSIGSQFGSQRLTGLPHTSQKFAFMRSWFPHAPQSCISCQPKPFKISSGTGSTGSPLTGELSHIAESSFSASVNVMVTCFIPLFFAFIAHVVRLAMMRSRLYLSMFPLSAGDMPPRLGLSVKYPFLRLLRKPSAFCSSPMQFFRLRPL